MAEHDSNFGDLLDKRAQAHYVKTFNRIHGIEEPMTNPRWQNEWPAFADALQERLQRGYWNYGDDSFKCSPADLMEALSEEALDLAGWGLVLWVRLRDLQRAAEAKP